MTTPQHRFDLLAAVYGEQAAEQIHPELEALLDASSGASHSASPAWSERSVWLIAYADSYIDQGAPSTLSTLGTTIDRHLDGIVDGVHVLPFAPWSSDGGFAVIDYDEVDPRYGSWADIEALSARRPVMFDAVINHMSAESPWFRQFLAGDPDHEGFFRTGDRSADVSAVVRPRTHPLFTSFERPDGTTVDVWTTFSPDQVDLDVANPAVLLRLIDVLLHYCRRGATAIRLDAIGFLWKDEATPSIHLPQTHRLIQLMRSCIDAVAPGTVLISETNVPHAENVSYFGGEGEREVHAVYQFALPPLAAHAALTGDTSVLETWAATLDELVTDERSFLNFLACHDGIGVRPTEGILSDEQRQVLVAATRRVGGEIGERSLPDGSVGVYELNTTWFDLMRADTDTDGLVDDDTAISRHLATHAVMLALPGIGAVYYHSITGASNDREAVAASGHARDINRARITDLDRLADELADPASRAHRIHEGLERLVAARRSSAAFHPTGRSRILSSPAGVFAVEREHRDERARVVVNLGSTAADVTHLVAGWSAIVDGEVADGRLAPGASLWIRP